MPFKKVGTNDYTSPSGRHFNQAQVRLWYAGGGKFPGEKGKGELKRAEGGPVMPALPTSIADVQGAAASNGAMVPGPPGGGADAVPAPQATPSRGTVVTPPATNNAPAYGPQRMARGGPVEGSRAEQADDRIRAKRAGMSMSQWEGSPADKRHDRSQTVAMAAGGPVLNRSRGFGKQVETKALPATKDEFTGGRMPMKQSAPAKQAYGKGK